MPLDVIYNEDCLVGMDRIPEDLLRGTKIPSDEMIQAVVKGVDLDDLKTDQIRILAAEDRRRHDARYRGDK